MKRDFLSSICPLPWLHFSAHLDSTMRICCNTDGTGFILDNEGKTLKLSDVQDLKSYFNLDYYKNIRAQMLRGEKPQSCNKCYEIEKYGSRSVRQDYLDYYLNDENWAFQLLKTDKNTGEIEPKVQSLDLSLSNNCNLKCIMCSPSASYPIKEDYATLGLPYYNDFVEGARNNWKDTSAIDRVMPEVAKDLRQFLTTGGEPFLSKEHFRILELIVASGRASEVKLSYHTNCTVRNDKLFELWNHFESVSIHFSIDAFGPLNEYIRFKTKWADVEKNVAMMVNHPKTHCEVHTTIQVLNVLQLPDLYEWINTIPNIPKLPFHIWMDQPNWLHLSVLPAELKKAALEKLEAYFAKRAFTDDQCRERVNQITSYLRRSIEEPWDEKSCEEFKKLIRQFEKLRNTPAIESLVPEFHSLLAK